ncbi:MAG: PBP1A family penicillin-binding protein [candidate division NC10 bacterium]|nr:PBP1A family penicillin-binding protein [candidate division NC10 bacterium]
MRRPLLRFFLWFFLIGLAITGGAAGGLVAAYVKDLPPLDPLENYEPSVATILYSDQDQPFASLFKQNRIFAPLSKIPKPSIQALIAVEDAQFYEHRGINLRGIARAMWKNVKCFCLAEGGSSITQQLAKVLFLTPEKSMERKVKEILLALEIERRYSKDKILELYFNQIYFGHGAYGAEAAAQTYFSKSVDQLILAEAATLAGLPRAPTYYSPIVDKERAKRRREHVLNRMEDLGFITKEQALTASKAPFDESRFNPTRNLAPYFVEEIRQRLEDQYGTYALYHGGLQVYTTLNLTMQKAAEEALFKGLRTIDKAKGYRAEARAMARERPSYLFPRAGEILLAEVISVSQKSLTVRVGQYYGELPFETLGWTGLEKPWKVFNPGDPVKVQILAVDEGKKKLEMALEQDPEIEGAFLAMDPRTGQIKAMIGGYDFERSQFNRAVQARRQPGSAFKPFVYAAAFDRGYTPSTVLDDSPISYPVAGGVWTPENYDRKFRGPTTLRQGLEHSINVMAVKLIERVGVQPVIELARALGIQGPLRPEYALALGVSEVTLLEMVAAYGVFANRGIRMQPYTIRKIVDGKGNILEERLPEGEQVMKEEVAFILTQILKGVIQRGTGKGAGFLERPLAGKTGTTQEATDVWFIGYTPSLVAGVWVGHDTKRSLGSHESSSHLAVPIWANFMQKVLPSLPEEDFPIPPNVIAIPVDYQTGRPAPPDDKTAVIEFFIHGTEPRLTITRTPAPPPGSPLEGPRRSDLPAPRSRREAEPGPGHPG